MAIDEIKRAILEAHRNPNSLESEKLTKFEGTIEAWAISAQLLHDASPDTKAQGLFRFFGARMIYNKIQRDSDQLDSNGIAGFMQGLVQHIITLSQLPQIETAVYRYVCLSIAAMAIQINHPGVVRSILQWLNPLLASAPHIVVLFLSLLPEESENGRIKVSNDQRKAFEHQLTDSFEEVMGFLESQWVASNELNRNYILQCATNWIEFTHITPEKLIQQPMYSIMLDCLAVKELFISAAKSIHTAFYSFTEDKSLSVLLEMSLPRILALCATWKSIAVDRSELDSELAKDICYELSRLFSVVAESSLELMLTPNSNFGQIGIIEQLLECCRYEHENKTSTYPLKFFFMLQERILDGMDSVVADEKAFFTHARSIYQPYFAHLIDISLDKCMMEESIFVVESEDNDDLALKDDDNAYNPFSNFDDYIDISPDTKVAFSDNQLHQKKP